MLDALEHSATPAPGGSEEPSTSADGVALVAAPLLPKHLIKNRGERRDQLTQTEDELEAISACVGAAGIGLRVADPAAFETIDATCEADHAPRDHPMCAALTSSA